MQILVSAGEASGDLYASGVVRRLRERLPGAELFGCAGPKLQACGVKPVIDAAQLSVVGLAEVLGHLPRIYGEYRKLIRYARQNAPDAALLADNPDFNLRVARQLKRAGLPVYYLVAPQVWAWRQGRVRKIRELVDHLFCLFPFEEQWFQERGVPATYIGHPLASMVRTSCSRDEFLRRHDLPRDRQTIVLLPGSREGEAVRHMPDLLQAVRILRDRFRLSVVLATPKGFGGSAVVQRFREPIRDLSIKVLEDQTWDAMGHSDVALAASGTVTVEAAILGTPMVIFYKVSPVSWHAGRRLVKVPYFSMVNLIAEREIAPELIQHDMNPERIAAETATLLTDGRRAERMRQDLATLKKTLAADGDPFERVADVMCAAAPFATAVPVLSA